MPEPVKIDVREVLRAKLPGHKVPEFVVRYLQRIVHEEEMNHFLREHAGETGYVFLDHVVHDLLGCSAVLYGAENIPQGDEPLIFVSTHPLGGLDGMINAMLLHEHRHRQMKLIVTDLLMYMRPLEELFVPVNKVGGQSKEYARRQIKMWESGCDVLSFPSGKCARLEKKSLFSKAVVTEQPWHKSVIQKAVQYKRDIVPIRFEGENSSFFYNLAYWRSKLGIKTNIEMLYLADEMFKSHGKTFGVHVLPPISSGTFDNTRTPQQWADFLREKIVQQ